MALMLDMRGSAFEVETDTEQATDIVRIMVLAHQGRSATMDQVTTVVGEVASRLPVKVAVPMCETYAEWEWRRYLGGMLHCGIAEARTALGL